MAYFTEELRDVDPRGLSSMRGVTDDTAANAIEAVGSLGMSLFKGKAAADLSNEAAQINYEFELDDVEAGVQDPVSKNYSKFMTSIQGLATDGRVDEYNLRAETALKKHINKYPGLADKFRQIAAEKFGFDPTGYSAKKKMKEIEDASFDAKQMWKDIDKKAQEYGLPPGAVYTEPGRKEFMKRHDIYDNLRKAKLEQELLKSSGMAADPIQHARDTYTQSQYVLQNTVGGMVKAHYQQFAPDGEDGSYSLGLMKKIADRDDTKQLMANLKNMERATNNSYAQIGAKALDRDYWIAGNKPTFDNAYSVLGADASYSDYEKDTKFQQAIFESTARKDPQTASLLHMKEAGLPLPEYADAKLMSSIMKVTAMLDPIQQRAFTIKELNEQGAEAVGALGKHLVTALTQVVADDDTTAPVDKDAVIGMVLNANKMFLDNPNGYKRSVGEAWIKAWSDPKKLPMLSKLVAKSEEFANSMNSLIKTHASNVYVQVAGIVKDAEDSSRFITSVINKEGEVDFTIDVEAIKTTQVYKLAKSDYFRTKYMNEVKAKLSDKISTFNARVKKVTHDDRVIDVYMLVNGFGDSKSGKVSRRQVMSTLLSGTDLGRKHFPIEEKEGQLLLDEIERVKEEARGLNTPVWDKMKIESRASDNPIINQIAATESGAEADPYKAENDSGAYGKYQFFKGTAEEHLVKMGKTWEDFKNDPDVQEEVMDRNTEKNTRELKKRGIPITPLNVWMAHNQGVGGTAQILRGKINAEVTENIAANIPEGMEPTPENYILHYTKTKGYKA